MTNRTAAARTEPVRTESVRWFSASRRRVDIEAQIMGRRAVYTTAAGDKLIGVITGTDRLDMYPVVTFADGRTGRLDNVITLVRENV